MKMTHKNSKFSAMLVVSIATLLLVSTGTVFAKPEPMITICHNTESETNLQVTIDINENAWSAHQAHGDTRGACQTPIEPVPELPTIALMGSGILGLLYMSRRIK